MLAILDYDAGNIESVRSALAHVGGDPVFVRDAGEAAKATRIVFPGVGTADQCMANLRNRGFDLTLHGAVNNNVPVLAVCIGMQLIFDMSEEDGGIRSVGIVPGRVRRFEPTDPADKVPHMGWNHVATTRSHPLLDPVATGGDFYFVHSYFVEPAWDDATVTHMTLPSRREPGVVYGACDYAGVRFAAMVGKGSLFACQFHPEKSGPAGLDILRRFIEWDGATC